MTTVAREMAQHRTDTEEKYPAFSLSLSGAKPMPIFTKRLPGMVTVHGMVL